MSTAVDKLFLERAVAKGLLTEEQAAEIRHLLEDGTSCADEHAVEHGFLTRGQAERLRTDVQAELDPHDIGGYRILKKIGSGSMGTVYKAKQLSLDRVVAIKILNPELSRKEDFARRFLREARTVARLNHPNVISGIDVGEEDGVRYFVMEFAAGMTVGRLVGRGGSMDPSRVSSIAVQIARALEHAHEAGLVHRDVKPDNILLTKDGTAKLCDLGLAKDRPEKGRSMGTPNYISPEQAKGEDDVDIRSDLYSFGCSLYHMLTGRVPFQGNAKMVMVAHLSEEPTPIRELEPDVSEEFARIVHKLMRKKRAERYQSPKELIGDLEAYFEVRKQQSSRAQAPQRSARRRRRR